MKLHATMIPYSGTVGGGLWLLDKDSKVQFKVSITRVGIPLSITREETAAIAKALIDGIPEPIEVPEKVTGPKG